MSENDFEKKVQQRMEEFNLLPTPAVWNSVEFRIRKEKKRRFIFFWLFMFLLAGIAGTIALVVTHKKPSTAIANLSVDKKIIPPPKTTDSNIQTTDNSLPEPQRIINKESSETALFKNKDVKISDPVSPKKSQGKLSISQKAKPSIFSSPLVKPVNKSEVQTVPDVDQKNIQVVKPLIVENKNNNEPVKKPISETPVPATKNQLTSPVIALTTDSLTKSGNSKEKKKKLSEWGLVLSAGRSTLIRDLRLFNKRYGDYNYSPLLSGPSSPAGNSVQRNFFKPSFSLSAGIYKKSKLSKKLDLLSGFSYQFLSARMIAGSRFDSMRTINNNYSQGLVINSFYRPVVAQLADLANSYYTNQYHFLELSADLSWKIINRDKLKIQWNNGFSYSRLVASNMLYYDYGIQGYYKDNNRLQKNQLFFKTSLDIPLTKRLSLSPFTSFSLTPVQKNYDTLQHYSNYGLQLRFSLNKK